MVTRKEWKRKNCTYCRLLDVQSSTDKKLATTQDHQTLQYADKKQYCCFWDECRKGFNFCWKSKAIVEANAIPQKIHFWDGATHERAYFHAFQRNGLIGYTCVGPQKLRWARAPRSLSLSLRLTHNEFFLFCKGKTTGRRERVSTSKRGIASFRTLKENFSATSFGVINEKRTFVLETDTSQNAMLQL